MIGIYTIINLQNGKQYIGQSNDVKVRLNAHKRALNNGKHTNPHLQAAWNMYGEKSFTFTILEKCLKKELNDREIYWIEYYGGCNSKKLYNQRAGGERGEMAEEAIQKMRVPHSPERIEARAKKLRGKKRDDETKKRMKAAQNRPDVIYKRNKAVREAMNRPEVWAKNKEINKGRILTREHKDKIRETLLSPDSYQYKKQARPVIQLSNEGELIKEWRSISEAQRELNIHNIIKVCKGTQHLAGGYNWRYKNE